MKITPNQDFLHPQICTKCWMTNHVAVSCDFRPFCVLCNETSHTGTQCPSFPGFSFCSHIPDFPDASPLECELCKQFNDHNTDDCPKRNQISELKNTMKQYTDTISKRPPLSISITATQIVALLNHISPKPQDQIAKKPKLLEPTPKIDNTETNELPTFLENPQKMSNPLEQGQLSKQEAKKERNKEKRRIARQNRKLEKTTTMTPSEELKIETSEATTERPMAKKYNVKEETILVNKEEESSEKKAKKPKKEKKRKQLRDDNEDIDNPKLTKSKKNKNQ
jgi:hypothetical protein